ncbi:hypothetical protein V2A60_006150 [Cordyceps javanica]
MPPRIVLLTGAPLPYALDEEKCTVQYFYDAFHQFIDAAEVRADGHHHGAPPATIAPWRSLSLHRRPLHTGFSQAHGFLDRSFHGEEPGSNDFFCPSSLTPSYDKRDVGTTGQQDEAAALAEFCEQSLAIHASLPSSQPGDDDDDEATTFLDETSFLSNSSAPAATGAAGGGGGGGQRPPAPSIPPAHLSDLEDVPSAKQLLSLQPQTVTLNVIAGVLSVAQPRSVTTRWGKTLSLVEVLLGDDTRSGFAVTFWLSSEVAAAAEAAAASDLLRLRRQDVVLLQNVALHVFRGKVYGQSLRRGQTKVHLLWSKRKDARPCYGSRALAAADTSDDAAENPQIVKTRLVRDWVLRFVGTDPQVKGLHNRDVWDQPPKDSQ